MIYIGFEVNVSALIEISPFSTAGVSYTTVSSFSASDSVFSASDVSRLPKPSIRGTVPRLNVSIAAAPETGFPDPSAIICMDCMGPHGISPFNSPTKNGLFSLLLFLFILSVSLCGNLIWNFLNNVIQPNMFIPMITMNKPAIIFNIPCRSSGIPIPPPPVNSIPIPPSKKPITEYEITRPVLYNKDGKIILFFGVFPLSSSATGMHCDRLIPPHIAIQ